MRGSIHGFGLRFPLRMARPLPIQGLGFSDEQRPSETARLSRRAFADIWLTSTHATFPKTSGSASARKFVAQRSPSPAISLKEMRARRARLSQNSLHPACELKYLAGLS